MVSYRGAKWGRDVVVFPADTSLYGTRDFFRAELSSRGVDYATMKRVPFDMDTSQVSMFSYLFDGCAELEAVPVMDTSKGTSFRSTFKDCAKLIELPFMDTSKATDMRNTFWGCSALKTIPALNMSSVTDAYAFLYNCASLEHVPDLDLSSAADVSFMLSACPQLRDGMAKFLRRDGSKPAAWASAIFGSGLSFFPLYDFAGNLIK